MAESTNMENAGKDLIPSVVSVEGIIVQDMEDAR